MNFKFIIFLILFSFSGCGVKSDPIAPKDSILPSYPDSFVNKEDNSKKKKKN